MVDLVEGIPLRVLDNEQDVVVAGDIFFLRKHPELVFPDKMVDCGKSRCIDPFKDIPEPFQPEKMYMLPDGESTRSASAIHFRVNAPYSPSGISLVSFKDIAAGPVIVQPLGLEIDGKGGVRDDKINGFVRNLRKQVRARPPRTGYLHKMARGAAPFRPYRRLSCPVRTPLY